MILLSGPRAWIAAWSWSCGQRVYESEQLLSLRKLKLVTWTKSNLPSPFLDVPSMTSGALVCLSLEAPISLFSQESDVPVKPRRSGGWQWVGLIKKKRCPDQLGGQRQWTRKTCSGCQVVSQRLTGLTMDVPWEWGAGAVFIQRSKGDRGGVKPEPRVSNDRCENGREMGSYEQEVTLQDLGLKTETRL